MTNISQQHSAHRAGNSSLVQRFLHDEASGGIVLVLATAVALVCANSPISGSYEAFWHHQISLPLGVLTLHEDVRHLVNDGAMTIFFFVVGLEIKRELLRGELASRRRATLPVAAAIGGMLVPAAIYASMNASGAGAAGWGIPMATDIAFAVGVLALAGPRAPTGLKVFLLALAIVDDLGAILVIAIFYTEAIHIDALMWGGAIVAAILAMRWAGVKEPLFYVIPGALLWVAVLESGVHATLAGVVLALLTPAGVTASRTGGEAPLDHLERVLHPWASFVVVPLFALANAGIVVSAGLFGELATSPIALGVIGGLVIGKPVGIVLAAWLAVRLGVASVPEGTRWRDVAGIGAIAGIGFTVAIFVSSLAFTDQGLVDEAKGGVFAASILAGAIGFVLLRLSQPERAPDRRAAASEVLSP